MTVSQYNTGVNYYIGRGIDKDLEKAVYWYQMASEEGHSKAPFNIGIIYANGEVTDKDLTLALEFAAALGRTGEILSCIALDFDST